MDVHTPVIFTDGTDFFEKLSKEYIRHEKGLFILAPSAAGKTYFITRQKEAHWIDGDVLWPAANADTTGDEWIDDHDVVMEVNNRCDVITEQAMKQGLWIIGSSNNWLKPNAIVLPPWELHQRYVTQREQGHYDGGAKQSDLAGLEAHRAWIAHWQEAGVPCFESVEAAALAISGQAAQQ